MLHVQESPLAAIQLAYEQMEVSTSDTQQSVIARGVEVTEEAQSHQEKHVVEQVAPPTVSTAMEMVATASTHVHVEQVAGGVQKITHTAFLSASEPAVQPASITIVDAQTIHRLQSEMENMLQSVQERAVQLRGVSVFAQQQELAIQTLTASQRELNDKLEEAERKLASANEAAWEAKLKWSWPRVKPKVIKCKFMIKTSS